MIAADVTVVDGRVETDESARGLGGAPRLRQCLQRREDRFVGGAQLEVDVHELPAHRPIAVDDVSCRMRPAASLWVQNAVAVDDAVPGVLE